MPTLHFYLSGSNPTVPEVALVSLKKNDLQSPLTNLCIKYDYTADSDCCEVVHNCMKYYQRIIFFVY